MFDRLELLTVVLSSVVRVVVGKCFVSSYQGTASSWKILDH